MPLMDRVKSFAASEAPNLREEKAMVLAGQEMKAFCRKYALPSSAFEALRKLAMKRIVEVSNHAQI